MNFTGNHESDTNEEFEEAINSERFDNRSPGYQANYDAFRRQISVDQFLMMSEDEP